MALRADARRITSPSLRLQRPAWRPGRAQVLADRATALPGVAEPHNTARSMSSAWQLDFPVGAKSTSAGYKPAWRQATKALERLRGISRARKHEPRGGGLGLLVFVGLDGMRDVQAQVA